MENDLIKHEHTDGEETAYPTGTPLNWELSYRLSYWAAPNRIVFEERLNTILFSEHLLTLKLTNFHQVNEKYGYQVGDQLLWISQSLCWTLAASCGERTEREGWVVQYWCGVRMGDHFLMQVLTVRA